MFKKALLIAGGMLASATALAIPMNGSVGFSALGPINWTGTTIDFNDPFLGGNAFVNDATGEFANYLQPIAVSGNLFAAETLVTFYDFDYTATTAQDIWSANGLSFSIDSFTSIAVDEDGSDRGFAGVGTLTDGIDSVKGTWSFSADNSNGSTDTFSWSSTTTASVTEPGTIALLALGLAGLATRKRIAK